jgi:signal transduction histidine kinase
MISHPKKLTLRVSDDGRGFQAEHSMQGMGLQIMRYRMRTLGGWLEVQQARGGGTRVTCVVPARVPFPGGLVAFGRAVE